MVIVCSENSIVRELSLEIVLDVDQFGKICGFEILNLMLEAGIRCLDIIKKVIQSEHAAITRFSYDEDSDAFYLRLADGRSFDQYAVVGKVALNMKGEIVRISASRMAPCRADRSRGAKNGDVI